MDIKVSLFHIPGLLTRAGRREQGLETVPAKPLSIVFTRSASVCLRPHLLRASVKP